MKEADLVGKFRTLYLATHNYNAVLQKLKISQIPCQKLTYNVLVISIDAFPKRNLWGICDISKF